MTSDKLIPFTLAIPDDQVERAIRLAKDGAPELAAWSDNGLTEVCLTSAHSTDYS